MGKYFIHSKMINKNYLLVMLIVTRKEICHVSSHSTNKCDARPRRKTENASLLQDHFLQLGEYRSLKLLTKIMDSLLFKGRAI